ncbi:SCO2522 family protein [Actinacidiphila alni]|uniref:SCO2522 family protein n=1 Tax=Actinacidiphila alni TaxID=380248 RepID=UPI0034085E50
MSAAADAGARYGAGDWTYRETTAEPRTEAVPYAHLSVLLGRFGPADLAGVGTGGAAADAAAERLRDHFARVVPLYRAARAQVTGDAQGAPARPRVSRCVVFDDSGPSANGVPPADAIAVLGAAAHAAGLPLDHLIKESGRGPADADAGDGRSQAAAPEGGGADIGALLHGRLVPEPAVGGNGARPAPAVDHRLSNGVRPSRPGTSEAMAPGARWAPPLEIGARRHSVFLDTPLWQDNPVSGTRRWSAPLLLAAWQLLRLGLLRDHGGVVRRPVPYASAAPPERWDDLPALVQLADRAAPFCAYRTFSVLDGGALPAAHAARVVLTHTAADPGALRQSAERAAAEGIALPPSPADRIGYAFTRAGPGGDAV